MEIHKLYRDAISAFLVCKAIREAAENENSFMKELLLFRLAETELKLLEISEILKEITFIINIYGVSYGYLG